MNKIDKMVDWFRTQKSRGVEYSMNKRHGPDYYDCSSSMYFALVQAFNLPYKKGDYIYNTSTLGGLLEKLGFEKITENHDWNAKKGDIIIWAKFKGVPGSEAHTALFTDSNTIVHCNYRNNGITEEEETNKHILCLYKWNYVVYRLPEETEIEGDNMENIQERYMIHGDYSIDSLPWFCSDRKFIKLSTEYNGYVVTVTRKWAGYFYSQYLGGWIDYRALVPVETIPEQVLTIKNGGYSVDTKPWGTSGYKTIMKTDELIGKDIVVTAKRGGYYYAHNMAKWIDMRAFE
jgi:Bacteriophage peptidoglycan hydrolase.